MHGYRIQNRWISLLTPEVVLLLTKIHEGKGRLSVRLEGKNPRLDSLMPKATLQSIVASHRLSGMVVSEERCRSMVLHSSLPSSPAEFSMGGYREALDRIGKNYTFLPVTPTSILEIHRALYHFCDKTLCGRFRRGAGIADAIADLCEDYQTALDSGADFILATALFVLQFSQIRPFDDNNGLMSRLLTLWLLYRGGDTVGRYVSLERIMERRSEEYAETISCGIGRLASTDADQLPFTRFLLECLLEAHDEFDAVAERFIAESGFKSQRIREIIRSADGQITKAEILAACPDISQITVQRALYELLKDNEIQKSGGGRYTAYRRNDNE